MSNSTLPIFKLLDISASHLTASTYELLANQSEGNNDSKSHLMISLYGNGDVGFVISVADKDAKKGLPADLVTVLQYAAEKKCDWVLLDFLAEVIEDLPTYERPTR